MEIFIKKQFFSLLIFLKMGRGEWEIQLKKKIVLLAGWQQKEGKSVGLKGICSSIYTIILSLPPLPKWNFIHIIFHIFLITQKEKIKFLSISLRFSSSIYVSLLF